MPGWFRASGLKVCKVKGSGFRLHIRIMGFWLRATVVNNVKSARDMNTATKLWQLDRSTEIQDPEGRSESTPITQTPDQ